MRSTRIWLFRNSVSWGLMIALIISPLPVFAFPAPSTLRPERAGAEEIAGKLTPTAAGAEEPAKSKPKNFGEQHERMVKEAERLAFGKHEIKPADGKKVIRTEANGFFVDAVWTIWLALYSTLKEVKQHPQSREILAGMAGDDQQKLKSYYLAHYNSLQPGGAREIPEEVVKKKIASPEVKWRDLFGNPIADANDWLGKHPIAFAVETGDTILLFEKPELLLDKALLKPDQMDENFYLLMQGGKMVESMSAEAVVGGKKSPADHYKSGKIRVQSKSSGTHPALPADQTNPYQYLIHPPVRGDDPLPVFRHRLATHPDRSKWPLKLVAQGLAGGLRKPVEEILPRLELVKNIGPNSPFAGPEDPLAWVKEVRALLGKDQHQRQIQEAKTSKEAALKLLSFLDSNGSDLVPVIGKIIEFIQKEKGQKGDDQKIASELWTLFGARSPALETILLAGKPVDWRVPRLRLRWRDFLKDAKVKETAVTLLHAQGHGTPEQLAGWLDRGNLVPAHFAFVTERDADGVKEFILPALKEKAQTRLDGQQAEIALELLPLLDSGLDPASGMGKTWLSILEQAAQYILQGKEESGLADLLWRAAPEALKKEEEVAGLQAGGLLYSREAEAYRLIRFAAVQGKEAVIVHKIVGGQEDPTDYQIERARLVPKGWRYDPPSKPTAAGMEESDWGPGPDFDLHPLVNGAPGHTHEGVVYGFNEADDHLWITLQEHLGDRVKLSFDVRDPQEKRVPGENVIVLRSGLLGKILGQAMEKKLLDEGLFNRRIRVRKADRLQLFLRNPETIEMLNSSWLKEELAQMKANIVKNRKEKGEGEFGLTAKFSEGDWFILFDTRGEDRTKWKPVAQGTVESVGGMMAHLSFWSSRAPTRSRIDRASTYEERLLQSAPENRRPVSATRTRFRRLAVLISPSQAEYLIEKVDPDNRGRALIHTGWVDRRDLAKEGWQWKLTPESKWESAAHRLNELGLEFLDTMIREGQPEGWEIREGERTVFPEQALDLLEDRPDWLLLPPADSLKLFRVVSLEEAHTFPVLEELWPQLRTWLTVLRNEGKRARASRPLPSNWGGGPLFHLSLEPSSDELVRDRQAAVYGFNPTGDRIWVNLLEFKPEVGKKARLSFIVRGPDGARVPSERAIVWSNATLNKILSDGVRAGVFKESQVNGLWMTQGRRRLDFKNPETIRLLESEWLRQRLSADKKRIAGNRDRLGEGERGKILALRKWESFVLFDTSGEDPKTWRPIAEAQAVSLPVDGVSLQFSARREEPPVRVDRESIYRQRQGDASLETSAGAEEKLKPEDVHVLILTSEDKDRNQIFNVVKPLAEAAGIPAAQIHRVHAVRWAHQVIERYKPQIGFLEMSIGDPEITGIDVARWSRKAGDPSARMILVGPLTEDQIKERDLELKPGKVLSGFAETPGSDQISGFFRRFLDEKVKPAGAGGQELEEGAPATLPFVSPELQARADLLQELADHLGSKLSSKNVSWEALYRSWASGGKSKSISLRQMIALFNQGEQVSPKEPLSAQQKKTLQWDIDFSDAVLDALLQASKEAPFSKRALEQLLVGFSEVGVDGETEEFHGRRVRSFARQAAAFLGLTAAGAEEVQQFTKRLAEISQGRTPTQEEVQELTAWLMADPVQTAVLRVPPGGTPEDVVRNRIEAMRKTWPAFSAWWQDYFKDSPSPPPLPIDSLWRVYVPLSQWILQQKREVRPEGVYVFGVSGSQGVGKTVLVGALASILNALLAPEEGQAVARSIDDYYKSKKDREELKPLGYDPGPGVSNRGPPGTHYTDWIWRNIHEFEKSAPESTTALGSFNKAIDDQPAAPLVIRGKVGIFLLEGWFLGANTHYDLGKVASGFKQIVAEANQRDYRKISDRLDALLAYKKRSIDEIKKNREEQEQLTEKQKGQRGMSPEAIARFVEYFYVDSWDWANTSPFPRGEDSTFVVEVDADRHFSAIERGGRHPFYEVDYDKPWRSQRYPPASRDASSSSVSDVDYDKPWRDRPAAGAEEKLMDYLRALDIVEKASTPVLAGFRYGGSLIGGSASQGDWDRLGQARWQFALALKGMGFDAPVKVKEEFLRLVKERQIFPTPQEEEWIWGAAVGAFNPAAGAEEDSVRRESLVAMKGSGQIEEHLWGLWAENPAWSLQAFFQRWFRDEAPWYRLNTDQTIKIYWWLLDFVHRPDALPVERQELRRFFLEAARREAEWTGARAMAADGAVSLTGPERGEREQIFSLVKDLWGESLAWRDPRAEGLKGFQASLVRTARRLRLPEADAWAQGRIQDERSSEYAYEDGILFARALRELKAYLLRAEMENAPRFSLRFVFGEDKTTDVSVLSGPRLTVGDARLELRKVTNASPSGGVRVERAGEDWKKGLRVVSAIGPRNPVPWERALEMIRRAREFRGMTHVFFYPAGRSGGPKSVAAADEKAIAKELARMGAESGKVRLRKYGNKMLVNFSPSDDASASAAGAEQAPFRTGFELQVIPDHQRIESNRAYLEAKGWLQSLSGLAYDRPFIFEDEHLQKTLETLLQLQEARQAMGESLRQLAAQLSQSAGMGAEAIFEKLAARSGEGDIGSNLLSLAHLLQGLRFFAEHRKTEALAAYDSARQALGDKPGFMAGFFSGSPSDDLYLLGRFYMDNLGDMNRARFSFEQGAALYGQDEPAQFEAEEFAKKLGAIDLLTNPKKSGVQIVGSQLGIIHGASSRAIQAMSSGESESAQGLRAHFAQVKQKTLDASRLVDQEGIGVVLGAGRFVVFPLVELLRERLPNGSFKYKKFLLVELGEDISGRELKRMADAGEITPDELARVEVVPSDATGILKTVTSSIDHVMAAAFQASPSQVPLDKLKALYETLADPEGIKRFSAADQTLVPEGTVNFAVFAMAIQDFTSPIKKYIDTWLELFPVDREARKEIERWNEYSSRIQKNITGVILRRLWKEAAPGGVVFLGDTTGLLAGKDKEQKRISFYDTNSLEGLVPADLSFEKTDRASWLRPNNMGRPDLFFLVESLALKKTAASVEEAAVVPETVRVLEELDREKKFWADPDLSRLTRRPILIDASDDIRVKELAYALSVMMEKDLRAEMDFRIVVPESRASELMKELSEINAAAAAHFLDARIVSYEGGEFERQAARVRALSSLADSLGFKSGLTLGQVFYVDKLKPSLAFELRSYFEEGGLNFVSDEVFRRLGALLEAA